MIGPKVIVGAGSGGGNSGGGDSGSGGGGSLPRFVRHSTQVITENGVWNRDLELSVRLPDIDPSDIRVQIELIGGGASGCHGYPGGSSGGNPGGVTFVKDPSGNTLLSIDDLEETYACAIGMGGAEIVSPGVGGVTSFSCNSGGSTSFGSWMAHGGGGIQNASSPLYGLTPLYLPPSDVPLSPAAMSYGNSNLRFPPQPSFGPGPGAAGGGTVGQVEGINGGASGADGITTRLAGGVAPLPTGQGGAGQDADEDGYGSGGASGSSGGAGGYGGGRGGFPGGGGGAGGCRNGGSGTRWEGNGGAGGNGAIRVRYFVREGAAA